MTKKMLVIGGFLMITVFAAAPSQAGGLFGHGGLIRGTVGNWIHDKVQAPIVTPVLKGAVVGAGAAAGTAAGALIGAPTVGGAVGAMVGKSVNDIAAGRKPGVEINPAAVATEIAGGTPTPVGTGRATEPPTIASGGPLSPRAEVRFVNPLAQDSAVSVGEPSTSEDRFVNPLARDPE